MGDGQPQVAPLTSTVVYKFPITFKVRSATDWNTFNAFFVARKTGDQYFTFTVPAALGGNTYLVQFVEDEIIPTWPKTKFYNWGCTLIGTEYTP